VFRENSIDVTLKMIQLRKIKREKSAFSIVSMEKTRAGLIAVAMQLQTPVSVNMGA
jgi:hypothetical protein